MVRVKLWGGLGNQMFQYALGRSLALKNRTYLQLDLSEYQDKNEAADYISRNFELDLFNVNYITESKENFIVTKILNYTSPVKYVQENGYVYDPSVLEKKGRLYLYGYWQCENYFKSIEDTISEDFTFKKQPNAANTQYLNQIAKVNAVSIHFRRGDYVTVQTAVNFNGICTVDYYKNAIAQIKSKLENPHFFVFSDDLSWVKENIDFKDPHTYVDGNSGEYSYEDMRLMAACKHNIIANSTFSWWGAWLNHNKDKVVVAPQNWFKTEKTDIIPDNWIKI